MKNEELLINAAKFGYRISIFAATLTIITFAIAIFTPPLSGPFCKVGCFQYPFLNIAGRFPRDYYWMYFAMVLMLFYLAMIIAVHQTVANNKKHYSLLAVAFGVMATLILITDYFIQVSVIQPSLLAGETEGISILSQFNPHGIFIVLEEIGFIFMVISFFCMIPAFPNNNLTQKSIKLTSVMGLFLTFISFAVISIFYGVKREYRFEVIVISIAWLELFIISLLYSRYFREMTLTGNVRL